MRALSIRRALLALCSAACLAQPAAAQIVVGQTAGFTGPVAASVKELTAGAELWIDAVNRRGGVLGQKIELVKLDDRFDPKLAAANARTLIVERGAMALLLARGTPHNEAILPLLKEHGIAMVGPSTGAMLLHTPVNPFVFNVRAPYQRESEQIVLHLDTIGVERIAVLHVADSFDADAVAGADRAFAKLKKKAVLRASYDRSKPDFAPLISRIVAADAQAVLFVGTAAAVVEGTRRLRAAGSRAQVLTLSNNASAGFIEMMGPNARGTVVSQVFPSERSMVVTLVNEARELMKARGDVTVTPAMLEGFAAAKVLVEGLKRAGPAPTRAKLIAALNGMQRYSVGGMEMGYSPSDHSGLDYVELSIIGPDGRFAR
jgi:ABC-type branched-subunit amino acid transport system substrate-binding protein